MSATMGSGSTRAPGVVAWLTLRDRAHRRGGTLSLENQEQGGLQVAMVDSAADVAKDPAFRPAIVDRSDPGRTGVRTARRLVTTIRQEAQP
jgi:hypothetical protein